jgi:hypothetical protein
MIEAKTKWAVVRDATTMADAVWSVDLVRTLLTGSGSVLARRIGDVTDAVDLGPDLDGPTTADHFKKIAAPLMRQVRIEAAARADLVERLLRDEPGFAASPAEYEKGSSLGADCYKEEVRKLRRELAEDGIRHEAARLERVLDAVLTDTASLDAMTTERAQERAAVQGEFAFA